MIDYFTIALTHGLIAIAAWRLLFRGDLDSDREPGAGTGNCGTDASGNSASGDAK